jgi:S-adenosylmethionine hydrolase
MVEQEVNRATFVVAEIEPNKEKGYVKITDGFGDMYSVWVKDLQDKFKVGVRYDVEFVKKGAYKNIVKILSTYGQPEIQKTSKLSFTSNSLVQSTPHKLGVSSKCLVRLSLRSKSVCLQELI